MNREHLTLIYQYALLLAAEEEWDQRELGPIHLLKLAYLADLAFAKANQGRTYTEVPWVFHKFGPWSNEALELIEEAAHGIEAEKKQLPGQYGKEFIRYAVRGAAEDLEADKRNLQARLPLEVWGTLQKAVHDFKADTKKLLHVVYATAPMLVAAPGDTLDFHCVAKEPVAAYAPVRGDEHVSMLDGMSKKKQRALADRMGQLRQEMNARYEAKKQRQASACVPAIEPGDMEVIAWVDSLAGQPFPEGTLRVEFDDSVWKSASRSGGEWGYGVST